MEQFNKQGEGRLPGRAGIKAASHLGKRWYRGLGGKLYSEDPFQKELEKDARVKRAGARSLYSFIKELFRRDLIIQKLVGNGRFQDKARREAKPSWGIWESHS